MLEDFVFQLQVSEVESRSFHGEIQIQILKNFLISLKKNRKNRANRVEKEDRR